MQNHDAPDELDDVEAHPSLLTFINKDPQPSLTAKTSSTALNKRGSKRANALVGNVTNKRALLSQVGQKSSRVLVPASRSLSLPGYNRNSTLLSTTQQQSDEIASNRSIGAASDSGQKVHLVSNAFENKSLRCESTVNPVQHSQTASSRLDRFHQISNNAQQKKNNSKGQRAFNQSNFRSKNINNSQRLESSSRNIPSTSNPADQSNFANNFVYSEYSNCSSVAYDQCSRMTDDTILNSESNSTYESYNSSKMRRGDCEIAIAGSSSNDNCVGGSLLSMVQGRCPPPTSSSCPQVLKKAALIGHAPDASSNHHSPEERSPPQTFSSPIQNIDNLPDVQEKQDQSQVSGGKEQKERKEQKEKNVNLPSPRNRAASWASIPAVTSGSEVSTPGGRQSTLGSPIYHSHKSQKSKSNDIFVLNTSSDNILYPSSTATTGSISDTLITKGDPTFKTFSPLTALQKSIMTTSDNSTSTNVNSGAATEVTIGREKIKSTLSVPNTAVGLQLRRTEPALLTVSSHVRPVPHAEKIEEPIVSMCYALEGRVTSVATTRDGSFIVVGFATGLVKVYELNFGTGALVGGGGQGSCNADLEDRYGHQIGTLANSNISGMFRVHLEMGVASAPASPSGENGRNVFSAHVFAGARLGSTRMIVADLLSLQRLKQKRGFITLAGGGVKTFIHTDIRLRGFSSLSTVSYDPIPPPAEIKRSSDEICALDSGYKAVYRVVCGGGYGTFNIWQVFLEAIPILTSSSASSMDVEFKYNEKWEVMHTGSVNARTMVFGLVLDGIYNSPGNPNVHGSYDFIIQGIQKDARIFTGREQVCDAELPINSNEPKLTKGESLRGVANVLAGSADGTTLFAGCDELLVYRLQRPVPTGELVVTRIETFTLSELVSVSGGVGPSRRGGRHLRQIEELRCTPDGQYAIIRCSDNAVVLYSCLDVFGVGVGPSRSESPLKGNDSKFNGVCGFISLWYQMEEIYGLKLNISYAASSTSLPKECEDDGGGIDMPRMPLNNLPDKKEAPLIPPCDVVLLTTWWQLCTQNVNLNKSGVLKADRLSCFTYHNVTSSSSRYGARSIVPVPLEVTRRGVGVVPVDGSLKVKGGMFSSNSNEDLTCIGNDNMRCWLCKCTCFNGRFHWPEFREDEDTNDENETHSEYDAAEVVEEEPSSKTVHAEHSLNSLLEETIDNGVPESKQKVAISTSNKRKKRAITNKKPTADSEVTACSASCSLALRGLQTKLLNAEADLQNARLRNQEKEKECRILVRKFDRRFEIEKKSRREWIHEKSRLMGKVDELQKSNMILEAQLTEMTHAQTLAMAEINQIFGRTAAVGESSSSSNIFNMRGTVSSSPSTSGNTQPFCVVCQAHTADTMILNCGHICLCHDHAVLMQENNQLDACPVCKMACVQICRVRGYETSS